MMTSLVLSLLLLIGGDGISATTQVQTQEELRQVNQTAKQPAETAATASKGDPCWTW